MQLHFLKENISGTATASMTLLPYGGNEYYVQKSGHISRITIVLTEARTAGTLTFKITKNGAAQTVLNAAIDSGSTQYEEVFGDNDDLAFLAGDRIGLQVVSAGFTPTTSDAVGIVTLEEAL